MDGLPIKRSPNNFVKAVSSRFHWFLISSPNGVRDAECSITTLVINLNHFSYLAELYYCLVFLIMLRFILLILYIMDTMFIKYLIFIWWGPSRFSVYHISQSTNSLLFSPILFDCYSMEIILVSVRGAVAVRRAGWRLECCSLRINQNSSNKSLIFPFNLLVCRNGSNNTINV